MIDLSTLTPEALGRRVRYTSTSGHTVMEGTLAKQVDDGKLALVKVTDYLKPKKHKADGTIVEIDPENLEFI